MAEYDDDDGRILMAKFRTCNNRLPVYVGRYQGVRRDDSVCNKCGVSVVGDEFHVFFNARMRKLLGYVICIYQIIIQIGQHNSNLLRLCKEQVQV